MVNHLDDPKLLNDDGIYALKRLARTRPNVFIEGDSDDLQSEMLRIADIEDLWHGDVGLKCDISEMNTLDRSGPSSDAAFVPLVRQALGYLPPSEGLNDYRWATINCFVSHKYVQMRWSNALPKEKQRLPAYIERHWFSGHKAEARQDNAIARLWWLGELSHRAAERSERYTEDDILNAMASNVNFYHQLLYRPNLLSRPKFVAALYEVFLEDGNDYLNATRYSNEMFRALNYRAADVSLDMMTLSELRDVVEDCQPPKER